MQTKYNILRLKHLVAMLKENRYPNHARLLKEMKRLDPAGAASFSAKTLQRDVAYLKSFYNAPIEYDRAQKGYYLLIPSWSIDLSFNDANETQAAVLGARIAEGIMPSPVRQEIRTAVDSMLSATSCEQDDYAMLESLVTTCNRNVIPQEVFRVVFAAWKGHRAIEVTYDGLKGRTRLLFEPHTLAFHEGNWYSVGLKQNGDGTKDFRTLAVHRIIGASMTPAHFDVDRKIVEQVNEGNIFILPTVKNIRMELSEQAFKFIVEQLDVRVESKHGGKILVSIESAPRYKIVNYVMAEGGEARILSHPELQKEVSERAQKVLDVHKNSDQQ